MSATDFPSPDLDADPFAERATAARRVFRASEADCDAGLHYLGHLTRGDER